MSKQTKSYETDFTKGKILMPLFLFALPLMLSGMLQLFYNAADIIVVGRFAGNESLAAVGSTSALINLLTNAFLGLSVGANVLVAKGFGTHDTKLIHRAVLGCSCMHRRNYIRHDRLHIFKAYSRYDGFSRGCNR